MCGIPTDKPVPDIGLCVRTSNCVGTAHGTSDTRPDEHYTTRYDPTGATSSSAYDSEGIRRTSLGRLSTEKEQRGKTRTSCDEVRFVRHVKNSRRLS